MRNSDSRSGSGAGSGVASSKSLPIPQSRVGSDHYNSSDAQNFSLPILTPDSESHSRNGSRNGSRSRIFGIGSEKSGLTFQIFKPTPDFLKVTPETAPEPAPDPEFSGSGVRIGIYSRSMSMSCLSSCKSHSRFSLPIPIPIFLLKVTPDFVRKSGVTQK